MNPHSIQHPGSWTGINVFFRSISVAFIVVSGVYGQWKFYSIFSGDTTAVEMDSMLVFQPSENLVRNGDFETEDLREWNIRNVSRTGTVSGAHAFGGSGSSAEINCNGSFIYIEQAVPVVANLSYVVSTQIDIDGAISDDNYVKIKVDFSNSSGEWFSWNNISKIITYNTEGYKEFSESVLAPVGSASLRVRLIVKNLNGGYVRFDDVSVFKKIDV